MLRHNSIDDEMRFSGLNKKTDIPSKAFMKLNQISINDSQNSSDFPQSKQENQGKHENALEACVSYSNYIFESSLNNYILI